VGGVRPIKAAPAPPAAAGRRRGSGRSRILREDIRWRSTS
jgi:hypothetical protein